MSIRKIRVHADRLGIITSVACTIHCTILPALMSSLPFLGFEILENKVIEWALIILALLFGTISLHHGYVRHHRKSLPYLLFITGFLLLVLNQVTAERFLLICIPSASLFIISAHVLNLYQCRVSRRMPAGKNPVSAC